MAEAVRSFSVSFRFPLENFTDSGAVPVLDLPVKHKSLLHRVGQKRLRRGDLYVLAVQKDQA